MALATALGIGAAVAGSVISGNKASSNANKAADAQVAVARENNALTRDIYNQNKTTLTPFVNGGVAAGGVLSDFYGIPSVSAVPSDPNYADYVSSNPDLQAEFSRVGGQFGNDPAAYGQYHYNTFGKAEGRAIPGAQAGGTVPAGTARSAFADYIANSDYAFQQQQGNNAINSGFAGAGTVKSGAAMKALEKYRQNLQSGYRTEWASGVAGQQNVGLGAASALAGVGQNFASMTAANNQSAADARSNAALSQQSGFGNALGALGSGILKGFG